MEDRDTFMELLDRAAAFHGHLCSGQIVGVRLAMLGLRLLGIADPYGKDRKRLVVVVEVARCAADAIMTVSGCRVGKRSFKIVDTGKVAATFLDMATGRAVRIGLADGVPESAAKSYPEMEPHEAEKKAYMELADSELFLVQDVGVPLQEEDTPGTPATRVRCAACGETVLDRREILRDGKTFCRPCAEGKTYYNYIHCSRDGEQPRDKVS